MFSTYLQLKKNLRQSTSHHIYSIFFLLFALNLVVVAGGEGGGVAAAAFECHAFFLMVKICVSFPTVVRAAMREAIANENPSKSQSASLFSYIFMSMCNTQTYDTPVFYFGLFNPYAFKPYDLFQLVQCIYRA